MFASKKSRALLVLLLVVAADGCGSSRPQHVEYARAEPMPEEPVPVPKLPTTVAYAARSFDSTQLSATPTTLSTAPKLSSSEVIDRANQAAAQGPEAASYTNAIQEYAYVTGSLYQIYAAPTRVTDIALEPGERTVGPPACGDPVRWKFQIGKSFANSVEQQHLYLKPTNPGLATNLIVNTTKRTYYLELHSYEKTYMASVQWRYPQDELDKMAAEAREAAVTRSTTTTVPSLEKLNFGYRIKVMDGEPRWTPTQVFDDGRRTFIRFPNAMLVREAPALFVMRDDQTQLVNYRVKKNMYIVDRLFEEAELRVGQDDPEIVRIRAER